MADDKREGADDLFEDLDKFFAPIKDVEWPEPETEREPAEAHEEHVAVHDHAQAPDAPEDADVAAEGDDAWYDTQSMEPVTEGTVSVPDAPIPGQEGLFVDEHEPPEEHDPAFAEEPVPPTAFMAPTPEEPSEHDVEAAAEHFAESVRAEETPEIEADDEMPAPYGDDDAIDGDLLADLGADEVEEELLSDLDEPAAARTVKVGAEGISGPSWQEPTSVEVGADLEGRGGRDMPAAFMTGLVLAVVAFGALAVREAVFAWIAAAIVVVGQFELFVAAQKAHKQPATAIGLFTGGLVMWAAYNDGESAVLAMFALGVIATFLWYMAVPASVRKDVLVNIGITILNIAYVPLLASFLLLLLSSFGSDGKSVVFAVITGTALFDIVAFGAGQMLGGSSIQRPLAPDTSPKKSWEGLLLASLIVIIASLALVPSGVGPFENTTRVNALLFGLVVSAAATFGDLAESLVKRDLRIKDMSGLLRGHGGVLDRIDSLLFAAPAAYVLLRVLFS